MCLAKMKLDADDQFNDLSLDSLTKISKNRQRYVNPCTRWSLTSFSRLECTHDWYKTGNHKDVVLNLSIWDFLNCKKSVTYAQAYNLPCFIETPCLAVYIFYSLELSSSP